MIDNEKSEIGVQFGPISAEQREEIYSSKAEKIVLPTPRPEQRPEWSKWDVFVRDNVKAKRLDVITSMFCSLERTVVEPPAPQQETVEVGQAPEPGETGFDSKISGWTLEQWKANAQYWNEQCTKAWADRDAAWQTKDEAYQRGVEAEHKSHVEFENELYATLVDSVAEGSIKEAEMRKQLLESARWYRQHCEDLEMQLNAIHAQPLPKVKEG